MTSLILDFSDNPHINYLDTISGSLKYAVYVPELSTFVLLGMGDAAFAVSALRRLLIVNKQCALSPEGTIVLFSADVRR